MTNLSFDPTTHTYYKDGQTVISTTQVLSDLSDFSKVPKHYMAQAQDRGTEVHKAIECYNETGLIEIEESLKGYFNSYLKFKKQYQHESLLNEHIFYSQLGYAGTPDSYGIVMGEKMPIDYKTCSQLDKSLINKTGLQLSAYGNLLIENDYESEKGLLIKLIPNKDPKLIFYSKSELEKYFEHFKKMLEYKKIIKYYKGGF